MIHSLKWWLDLGILGDPQRSWELRDLVKYSPLCHSHENLSVFTKMYHSTRIFKSVSFSLFCINNLLFFSALTILWVHLNGYIIKSGLGNSSEAGCIYSIIGISNVIGRIFLGLFCDLKRVNPIVVYTMGNFFLALNELYASYAQTFRGNFF